MKQKPEPSFLSRVLRYDSGTGNLFWRKREVDTLKSGKQKEALRWNARYAEKLAFTARQSGGYACGAVNKVVMQAHVVAWAIYYGEWPEGEIDHINGIRTDNRICNLRVVSSGENQKNKKIPRNNTSGVIGVSYCKRDKVWIAHIMSKRISSHKEISEAISARKNAEINMGFHENHGRKQ